MIQDKSSHFIFFSVGNLHPGVINANMKSMVLMAVLSNILTTGVGSFANTINRLPSATYLNVAYGPDAKQVMDIYLPAGRAKASTKVMMLIHGGSWSGGDKQSFQAYVDSLQQYLPDYAFININYRLATYTANRFPAQENDIKAALTYVIDKTDEYNISHNVVLLGASAGAHLALLQAYKYTEPVKVQAVISFFGPTDMEDIYNHPIHPQVPMLMQVLMGGTPVTNPDIYKQSSPLNFVTPQSCPTLLFHGGNDPLVNPKQSALLKDKLQQAGVANELIVYPNEGHGWHGRNLGDSFSRIGRFLHEQVK